jgi:hypothetical protein
MIGNATETLSIFRFKARSHGVLERAALCDGDWVASDEELRQFNDVLRLLVAVRVAHRWVTPHGERTRVNADKAS